MLPVTALDTLTQGWSGLAVAYGAVQAPLLAGMVRARAAPGRLLRSPLAAVPLTFAAGAASALVAPLLSQLDAAPAGLVRLAAGAVLYAGCGYAAGRVLGRTRPTAARHQRGAIVDENVPVPRPPRAAGPDHAVIRERALRLAGG